MATTAILPKGRTACSRGRWLQPKKKHLQVKKTVENIFFNSNKFSLSNSVNVKTLISILR